MQTTSNPQTTDNTSPTSHPVTGLEWRGLEDHVIQAIAIINLLAADLCRIIEETDASPSAGFRCGGIQRLSSDAADRLEESYSGLHRKYLSQAYPGGEIP
jgi:hypothetical protein